MRQWNFNWINLTQYKWQHCTVRAKQSLRNTKTATQKYYLNFNSAAFQCYSQYIPVISNSAAAQCYRQYIPVILNSAAAQCYREYIPVISNSAAAQCYRQYIPVIYNSAAAQCYRQYIPVISNSAAATDSIYRSYRTVQLLQTVYTGHIEQCICSVLQSVYTSHIDQCSCYRQYMPIISNSAAATDSICRSY